ncbi:AmpG family muropeptide MFS transporter [Motiliproteus sediminis]|uniref:AmpG family muropeptide MFS transporter n=1 Tax=Motiliproteus sediminis TaxID=1468178 RepID=UPI001FE307EB|nr:AmpG family muropeptide MFS transporter [Motiliproteus sediminis]
MNADRSSALWNAIFNRRMLICILTGFSSGLPLYILYQLVPAWLRDEGVSLETIGLFSLVAFPYTWKFLWSPALDRYVPPLFGRRRGWMILTQLALLLSIAAFALFNPTDSITAVAYVVFAVALFSATQDIVLDAYRRELLPDEELGLGNSLFVNAYRFSSLVPGSLALILADQLPWETVHLVVAAFMLVGLLTSLFAPEPVTGAPPLTLRAAVVEPFHEFFSRSTLRTALAALGFILLYKLGDSMATALSTPFYLDLGFSKTEIGTIAKGASLGASIVGGLVGGVVMIKLGINRSLWIFGVVQVVSILGFAALAEIGANPSALFAVVAFEYFGVGLGTAAFVAFMARLTDKRFTATQLALFTSLASIPRTFANASTGFLVEAMGYTDFFLLCALIALPGMLMLFWVAPWSGPRQPTGAASISQ